jgi:hypothetical protein
MDADVSPLHVALAYFEHVKRTARAKTLDASMLYIRPVILKAKSDTATRERSAYGNENF